MDSGSGRAGGRASSSVLSSLDDEAAASALGDGGSAVAGDWAHLAHGPLWPAVWQGPAVDEDGVRAAGSARPLPG